MIYCYYRIPGFRWTRSRSISNSCALLFITTLPKIGFELKFVRECL